MVDLKDHRQTAGEAPAEFPKCSLRTDADWKPALAETYSRETVGRRAQVQKVGQKENVRLANQKRAIPDTDAGATARAGQNLARDMLESKAQMPSSSKPEDVLAAAGIVLSNLPAPGRSYLSVKRARTVVYLAGVISTGPEGVITGPAGLDRSIKEGYAAARAFALTQFAVLKRELGSLDRVAEILTVNC